MKSVKSSFPSQPAIGAGVPDSRSNAIFQALVALRDPSASHQAVREYIQATWPQFPELSAAHPHWSAYVTQRRNRAAQALGVPRQQLPRGARRKDEVNDACAVTVQEVLALWGAQELLKNPQDLPELVTLISRLGPPHRAAKVVDAVQQLGRQGGPNKTDFEAMLREVVALGLRVAPVGDPGSLPPAPAAKPPKK